MGSARAELFVLDRCVCLLLQRLILFMPDTAADPSQPLKTTAERESEQQEHSTLTHRKAQSSLRTPVKRCLDGCPSQNSYHFLPRRHSAEGDWEYAFFVSAQHFHFSRPLPVFLSSTLFVVSCMHIEG